MGRVGVSSIICCAAHLERHYGGDAAETRRLGRRLDPRAGHRVALDRRLLRGQTRGTSIRRLLAALAGVVRPSSSQQRWVGNGGRASGGGGVGGRCEHDGQRRHRGQRRSQPQQREMKEETTTLQASGRRVRSTRIGSQVMHTACTPSDSTADAAEGMARSFADGTAVCAGGSVHEACALPTHPPREVCSRARATQRASLSASCEGLRGWVDETAACACARVTSSPSSEPLRPRHAVGRRRHGWVADI